MSMPTDPTVMLLHSFFLTTMTEQYVEVMQPAEEDGWGSRCVASTRRAVSAFYPVLVHQLAVMTPLRSVHEIRLRIG